MPMVHTFVYDTIKRGISLTGKGKGEQQAEKWKNTWLAGILLFLMSPELRISTGNSVSRSHLFSLWYLWVCDVTSIYANGFYLHSSVFLAKILLRSHFFNFKESQVQWKINTAHSSPHPKCGCGRVLQCWQILQQRCNDSFCTNLPTKAVKWCHFLSKGSMKQLMSQHRFER